MHAELVAPRPLRLTSASFTHAHPAAASSLVRPKPAVRLVSAPPTDAFAHISLADGEDELPADRERPASALDDPDAPGARRGAASPRLSPDALEEFLSILRPAVFSTPGLRARYERPHPYRPRAHRRTRSAASDARGESPRTPERAAAAQAPGSDELGDELVFDPRPWPYASFLSSPISRIHTQNPLARHAAHPEGEGAAPGAHFFRAPPSPAAALALAQSVPIPPSPPAQTSPSPHAMDV